MPGPKRSPRSGRAAQAERNDRLILESAGAVFLADMRLVWWEATGLFGLWLVQFAFSPVPPGSGIFGFLAVHIHRWVTIGYWMWAAIEIARIFAGRRRPRAFHLSA